MNKKLDIQVKASSTFRKKVIYGASFNLTLVSM